MKKRKNKRLKDSIKSNLAEKLTTIIIFSPNKKLQWSICCYCTNINNIPKTCCEKVECKESINL